MALLTSALSFANATSNRITLPSSTGDNMDPATFLAWAQLNTLSQTGRRIFAKTNNHLFYPQQFVTPYGLECKRTRATTACDVQGEWTNFVYAAANKPLFLVGQSDTSTAGNNRLYVGDIDHLPIEPTTYTLQTNGSGTVTSNAGGAVQLGNQDAANFGLDGVLWFVAIFNRLLSLPDIYALYRASREGTDHPLYATSRGVWFPALSGVGVVVDRSGGGRHGIVSGATPRPMMLPRLGRRRAA